MSIEQTSPFLNLLKNRIDLVHVPFTERGSRILLMQRSSGLIVRLVERWFKVDRRLSAYRQRPPIVEDWVFTDGDGQPLEVQLESYPHRLNFQTSVGQFAITFADTETLLVQLPDQACGLRFLAHVNVGDPDRRGGSLHVTGDIRRNIAYTTNRPFRENCMELTDSGSTQVTMRFEPGEQNVLLFNLTPRLGFNRYLPQAQAVFTAAAQTWHDWFAAAPPVAPELQAQYYYAWWVMRAGLISTRFFITHEAMTPSKIHYVGVWQWDAYFHALAYRFVDRDLARGQLRVMLDHQDSAGMIPDAVHDEGAITHLDFPVNADVTKPPILAWAAWKLYEHDQDAEFLDEIYEGIQRWNQWWFRDNDQDGDGLCEYHHPFSSGLDDNPLWDGGVPVTSPDLNTYLYLQMEALGRIAGVLGLSADSHQWQQRADELLEKMVTHLWDPQAGLFWAYRGGEPIRILTPFSLFPLLTGRLEPAMARRLVDHLFDPATFWTRYPVPTVAINQSEYDPTQMWRGPTWINSNYLLWEGLLRSGFPHEAAQLRRRTLELVQQHSDIFEYYHPQTGELCPKAASMFGWSAALFIELALQENARRSP